MKLRENGTHLSQEQPEFHDSMAPTSHTGGLVYSTELGRTCPVCRRATAQCSCKSALTPVPTAGNVRVVVEKKGRGGKTVTVVRALPLDGAALLLLAKDLRNTCGSGGTVKDGMVELQGDHHDKVEAMLRTRGLLK